MATVGMPVGIAMIVISWLLTGAYVPRANTSSMRSTMKSYSRRSVSHPIFKLLAAALSALALAAEE